MYIIYIYIYIYTKPGRPLLTPAPARRSSLGAPTRTPSWRPVPLYYNKTY